jgi:hypothetical protein
MSTVAMDAGDREVLQFLHSLGALGSALHCRDLHEREAAALIDFVPDAHDLHGDAAADALAVAMCGRTDAPATMRTRWAELAEAAAHRLQLLAEVASLPDLGVDSFMITMNGNEGCAPCAAAAGMKVDVASIIETWELLPRMTKVQRQVFFGGIKAERIEQARAGKPANFLLIPPWHRGCTCSIESEP